MKAKLRKTFDIAVCRKSVFWVRLCPNLPKIRDVLNRSKCYMQNARRKLSVAKFIKYTDI